MFKNAIIYRVSGLPKSAQALADALAHQVYQPCSPNQERSEGWVPPRGQAHGALVETVEGQWIACLTIETRTVPAADVRRRAQEAAEQIEKTTGRKPGRKELRDLRDDARAELLPRAFSRVKPVLVWIAPLIGRLVIDSASQTAADAVITGLVRAMPQGFTVGLLQTATSPQAAMTEWLMDEDAIPGELFLGRAGELRGTGDEPVRIKFSGHDMTAQEVREHVIQGALPVSLALSDGRVEATLTHTFQLRKIALPDGVMQDGGQDQADRFDADVALMTGELRRLIDELVKALGGELHEAS
jgi:recombination associated protein RdgC